MPASTVNKETARTLREAKDQVAINHGYKNWDSMEDLWYTSDSISITAWTNRCFEAAQLYAKSCSSLAWDACGRHFAQTEYESEITAPDKETYLTNLFPNGN